MKKIIIFLMLMILSLIAVGCSQEPTDTIGAYTTVIDKLYNEDDALNSEIKFIAIDTSLIKNLTDEQKFTLLKEVEKYGYTVLDMTFEELEENGYIEDLYFKEGILFRLEDNTIKGKSIIMDASKWRSGLGAIGYNGLQVEYKNGEWKITKVESSWIS
ncbi:hypothetical protein [Sedimentibacter sp.]|uniref:hypothetical protein n=1 Tax=Sedimentibacter sp. TaxID=1960295 RepID=UPI00289DFBF4|nr:hypothetical protein [Sedimentibacter sp.]